MDNSITLKTSRVIDFWFEFGSNYSYLSVMRIEEAATKHGVAVRWQPFLLGPIFRSFGWESSPFVLQKQKGDYAWIDMARQCDKYGLAWKKPSNFPRSAILPLRVALIGADKPWMGDYCKRIMQLNFAADTDIDSRAVVSGVLAELGLPSDEIIAAALTDENKLKLRSQTERAQELGIFGAPTFFVGKEMFWGNDRLDDALAYCERVAV